jgi:arylsulfatase A-like enzyme
MRSYATYLKLSACVLLGLSLAACVREPDRGRSGKGVLLIVVDELRADHVGTYGYPRATTPHLDGLLSEGMWFSNAFSPAPDTIPSHASVLTGVDPSLARRPPLPGGEPLSLMTDWFIPEEVPRIAREFLVEGYRTAAFMDHAWLSPVYGFRSGFELFRGFREGGYVTVGFNPDGSSIPRDFGMAAVRSRLEGWLEKLPQDQDWFAYLTAGDLERTWAFPDQVYDNFFTPDPEQDQIPAPSSSDKAFFAVPRNRWPGALLSYGEYEARYDGALLKLDSELHKLFSRLEAMGRWEETTVCIVGSYGLGLGEAGLIIDHGTLADVDLHVPVLLRPANSAELVRGREVDALMSLLDVAPTLLELSGVQPPAGMHGVSMVPVLKGEEESVREYAYSKFGIHGGFSVHDERYSFELFDPASRGPASLVRSWFGQQNPQRESFVRHLRDRETQSDPGNLTPSVVQPEVEERLKAVGEEWYEWIERARYHVQDAPWAERSFDQAEREELERRGLIAPSAVESIERAGAF